MACHAIYPDVYRPRLPGEPAVEQEFSRERNEYKHPPLFMQDKEKMVAAMRARNRIRRQAWFCQNPWIHPDSPWIGHRTSTIPLKLKESIIQGQGFMSSSILHSSRKSYSISLHPLSSINIAGHSALRLRPNPKAT